MSKKLEANGLWESSRMMLPQHKERIIQHRTHIHVQTKPILHEDEWEIMAQHIEMSLNYTLPATIEIFHESGNRYIHGSSHPSVPLERKSKLKWRMDLNGSILINWSL